MRKCSTVNIPCYFLHSNSHLYWDPIKFPSSSLLLPLKFPFHVPFNFPSVPCCSYFTIHAESESNRKQLRISNLTPVPFTIQNPQPTIQHLDGDQILQANRKETFGMDFPRFTAPRLNIVLCKRVCVRSLPFSQKKRKALGRQPQMPQRLCFKLQARRLMADGWLWRPSVAHNSLEERRAHDQPA